MLLLRPEEEPTSMARAMTVSTRANGGSSASATRLGLASSDATVLATARRVGTLSLTPSEEALRPLLRSKFGETTANDVIIIDRGSGYCGCQPRVPTTAVGMFMDKPLDFGDAPPTLGRMLQLMKETDRPTRAKKKD